MSCMIQCHSSQVCHYGPYVRFYEIYDIIYILHAPPHTQYVSCADPHISLWATFLPWCRFRYSAAAATVISECRIYVPSVVSPHGSRTKLLVLVLLFCDPFGLLSQLGVCPNGSLILLYRGYVRLVYCWVGLCIDIPYMYSLTIFRAMCDVIWYVLIYISLA